MHQNETYWPYDHDIAGDEEVQWGKEAERGTGIIYHALTNSGGKEQEHRATLQPVPSRVCHAGRLLSPHRAVEGFHNMPARMASRSDT